MDERRLIRIHKVDEATCSVECSDRITEEMKEYFTCYAPNYRFHPKYKARQWDGKLRFVSYDKQIPIGLCEKIEEFATRGKYNFKYEFTKEEKILRSDFNEFVLNLKITDDDGNPMEPRDYQLEAAYDALTKKVLNISSTTSCHMKGDMVLMYDGSWKKIEDICIGEYLIGKDGTPKKVKRTFIGEDEIFRIEPKNNREHIHVTKNHVLPIKLSDYSKKYSRAKGDKHFIEYKTVEEYINSTKTYKHIANIFFNDKEIEFNNVNDMSDIKLTPYFIGLYIGDGSTYSCEVTTNDSECVTEIYNQAKILDCVVANTKKMHYFIKGVFSFYDKQEKKIKNRNKVFKEFDKLGITFSSNSRKHISCGDRFIPEKIFTAPVWYRLEVLAGLIDSDGHLSNGTNYDLTFKSKTLRDDIARLAISLGLVVSTTTKHNKKYKRDYFRVSVMGDIYKIPVRIKRKQTKQMDFKRDPYRSKFNVIPLGKKPFYGIEVEGSHYITNGGMITHNSGKSLIVYIIVRWLIEHDERILCIFPTTQLVEQIYSDFESYGWEDIDSYCCMIYSGKKRLIERQVHLATWQSIASMTKASYNELLASYTAFIQDEAHNHSGSSKVLSSLSKRCINAHYRIGTSGSYPDKDTADWFSVVGATGSIKVYSTYKKLQEAGYISGLKINVIRLNYHIDIKTENYNTNVKGKEGVDAYNLETEFINNHPLRNEFISKLLNSVKGNSLVLVTKVDEHGIPLYNYLKQKLPNKRVMYIDGSIPVHERELIRRRLELENGCVLVATYKTLSTGVNIKRLHNVIFAAGTKSRYKVIQSVGRGLRKYKDKKYMQLFDLVDDLSFVDKINDIKYMNYSVKHYKERKKLYSDMDFTVNLKTYNVIERN